MNTRLFFTLLAAIVLLSACNLFFGPAAEPTPTALVNPIVVQPTDRENTNTVYAAAFAINPVLESGKTYIFTVSLICENTVAADGLKLRFGPSGLTTTLFSLWGSGFDSSPSMFLGTYTENFTNEVIVTNLRGPAVVHFRGSLTTGAAGGTLQPEFALFSKSTGVVKIKAGSSIEVREASK